MYLQKVNQMKEKLGLLVPLIYNQTIIEKTRR